MQDLQAFPKSAIYPSTEVTLLGQRRMQVKRLIIRPVGNQLLLFFWRFFKVVLKGW